MAEAPGYWKAEHALAMREVASLEARVKRLEEAAKPFAELAGFIEHHHPSAPDNEEVGGITIGDLRRLAAALKDIPDA